MYISGYVFPYIHLYYQFTTTSFLPLHPSLHILHPLYFYSLSPILPLLTYTSSPPSTSHQLKLETVPQAPGKTARPSTTQEEKIYWVSWVGSRTSALLDLSWPCEGPAGTNCLSLFICMSNHLRSSCLAGHTSGWLNGWMACLAADWLLGWLTDWMNGSWTAGWMVGWLASWLAGGCLASWLPGWLAGLPIGWMACWLNHANRQMDACLSVRLVDSVADSLTSCMDGWINDWLLRSVIRWLISVLEIANKSGEKSYHLSIWIQFQSVSCSTVHFSSVHPCQSVFI